MPVVLLVVARVYPYQIYALAESDPWPALVSSLGQRLSNISVIKFSFLPSIQRQVYPYRTFWLATHMQLGKNVQTAIHRAIIKADSSVDGQFF